MFSSSASFYDELYAFRDFDGEARRVLELHRAETGNLPRRILDVGCATGAHAAALAHHAGCEVWGIDLERALISRARRRHRNVRFRVADMMRPRLPGTFDLITSFYGVVAYARTPGRLGRAIRAMTPLLSPGGVAWVEPWHLREHYVPRPTSRVVETATISIARASSALVRGRQVDLRVAYTVARNGRLELHDERHRLGLFSSEEMMKAFEGTGMRARWVAGAICGRA